MEIVLNTYKLSHESTNLDLKTVGSLKTRGKYNKKVFTLSTIFKWYYYCQVQTKNAPICSAKVHHLVTPIC
jgi:hypothetical protein